MTKLYTALQRDGLPEPCLKGIFKESLVVLEKGGKLV